MSHIVSNANTCYAREGTEAQGTWIALSLLGFIGVIWNAPLYGLLWAVGGAATITLRIWFATSTGGSTFGREFSLMVNNPERTFVVEFLYWPVPFLLGYPVMLYRGTMSYETSYKEGVRASLMSRSSSVGMHMDTAYENVERSLQLASESGALIDDSIERLAENVREAPLRAVGTGVAVVAFSGGAASADPGTTFDVPGGQLELTGWADVFYDQHRPGRDVDLGKVVGIARLKFDNGFSAMARIDALRFRASENNAVVEDLWVGFDWSKTFHIRVGRVFLSSGFPTPPPFILETVRYPRVPGGLYATGVQFTWNPADDLTVVVDVTGKAGYLWNDADQFDDVEFSGRLSKKLGNLTVAGTVEVREAGSSYIFDASWEPRPDIFLKGATYVATPRLASSYVGAYMFVAYRPRSGLELHTQLDSESDQRGSIWTSGITASWMDDRFSFTVDYEHPFGGKEQSRSAVLARFRIRY